MLESVPIRILLLEDSDLQAKVLLRQLKRQNSAYEAHRAASRAELLDRLDEDPWDIVLSDYYLKDLNALEVLTLLRERLPGVPCIVVSEQIGEEQAVDALRAGARDYVSKKNVDRLFHAVTRELEEARHRKQWESSDRARMEMEIQLRQAQKLEAIGQLAAGIAHEINTPTQFIGDNARFLGDILPDLLGLLSDLAAAWTRHEACWMDAAEGRALQRRIQALDLDYLLEEMPKAVAQSLDGVARVSRIVSAMKDFSHPGGEGWVATDLNRSIESTLTVSRNEWKYVAELDLNLDPELPPVPCHPGEFNQVVLNLVVNAAQAIEESLGGRQSGRMGRIGVSTVREHDWALLRISDTGRGIPEAIVQRIFDPFFTTKPVGKGTGQGLAIARAVIVDRHGGTIQVESRPEEGTTFTVRIPLRREA